MTTRDGIVDIALPTLGQSPYLADAVESIFAQTFQSWRLVISENGPAGEEVPLALGDYLGDGRVHHRVVGEYITQAANWSRAIQDGTAKYVAMLNDDDRWDPDFLSKRVAFLETHPQCGFVFAGYRTISQTGEVIDTIERNLPQGAIRSSTILPILYENCLVTPPTALVRRAAYQTVGAEFREVLLPDYEMWIRLAAHFDIGFLSVCDSDYRFHGDQTTAGIRSRIGEGHLEIIEATKSLPIPMSVRQRTRARAHLLCAIDNVELGKRRKALRHLRSAVRAQPVLLVRPGTSARMLLALVGMALGERGARAFAALRSRRYLKRTGGKTRAQRGS
jgi:glycosyltransferase involved in cell wall biosynthesis